MRLHSYIVEHDLGFAPNPFQGICTLATCKPKIRKYALVGDYIVGTGAKKRKQNGRLVYVMRVGRITTFDNYWRDPAFARKRPVLNGSLAQRYGDNIYHHDPRTGDWHQEDSFHSQEDGSTDFDNLIVDVGTTDQVLVGDWFAYWGGNAPNIPQQFSDFIHSGIGHKKIENTVAIDGFLKWVKSMSQDGLVGDPCEWQYLKS